MANGKGKGKSARSGASSKKKKTQKSKQSVISNEIKGVILITLGIFIALTFLLDMGIIGGFIKNILTGLFGKFAVILSVFVMWIGMNLIIDKRENAKSYKPWLLIGLMLFSSMIAALWDKAYLERLAENGTLGIGKLYTLGTEFHGGGVFGSGLCIILCDLISATGVWIFSAMAMLILILILTGVSLGKVCRKIGETVKKKSKNAAQSAKERREERRLLREEQEREAEEEENLVALSPQSDFSDDDLVPNKKYNTEDESGQNYTEEAAPARFVLTEDEFPQFSEYTEVDRSNEPSLREDAPFHPKDIKTGTITPINEMHDGAFTPLPDENGNFKEEKDEFEPPTLESMKERLEPATQAAIDSGVPLDRAVEVGQKIQKGEILEAANKIDNMVSKAASVQKIVDYKLPPISLFGPVTAKTQNKNAVKNELEEKANRLLETLASFHVDAKILNITQGPAVTRFELQPGPGVKVSKITNLSSDIALSLAATGVRIEAPIPGKAAVGIEIPNGKPSAVHIREVLETDEFRNFKSKTAFALGKDISGKAVITDISQFPHVLIAGATGSGKSVCINSLIASILYKAKPDEVKMIMIDPKMVELGVYNGIPHLLIPVVTNPKHAAGALNWAVAEMKRRYTELKNAKVRNIEGYNKLMEKNGTPEYKMPEIVIIIDELADLMVTARNEVETSINSLAALARAAGMYLVIATQRPSVDVITGVIKANIPSRIAFAVSSQTDSRTIIDAAGADKLLGKGDMLYFPRGATKPTRVQGNFLSDGEIESIIDFIKNQYEAEYDESIIEQIEKEPEESHGSASDDDVSASSGSRDELFVKAVEMVIDSGQASVAMFQRRFKIGYQRAARLVDKMEEMNIIGPYEGTKPRQVLMTRQEFNEMLMNESE